MSERLYAIDKSLNKKLLKIKKATKSFMSVLVALTLCLNLVCFSNEVNAESNRLSYFNDYHYLWQTRIMMDGNNFLKNGYWMHVNLTPVAEEGAALPKNFSATLEFTIPGYNMSNLKFFVFDKNSSRGGVNEYVLENVGSSTKTPVINIPSLAQSTYEVHVYDGALEENLFVCKADFCVTNKGMNNSYASPLLDSAGNAISEGLNLTCFKKNPVAGDAQTCLMLPSSLVPYNSRTVKVVFFATDRGGAPVNIDKTLYDYVWATEGFNVANGGNLYYYPEGIWGTESSVKYEAHFYKDEVVEGNFICKAVGIVLS